MLAIAAGLALCAIGFAGAAGLIPQLADYTYPIVWWGILVLADEWNWRRHELSLWRGRVRQFLLITVPASVLFWLVFEILNLASPQWHYRGDIPGVVMQTVFGFVAFATVLPIMAESYWAVLGGFCLPSAAVNGFRRWRGASIVAALVFMAIPFFNAAFWWNQGMWIAPALLILPFRSPRPCARSAPFLAGAAAAGLVAGVLWEAINFTARTRWEYLILPQAPHLFEMPLPGYIGFIPFGMTALLVYEWQREWKPRVVTGIALYAAALGLLYALTEIYLARGLWRPAA